MKSNNDKSSEFVRGVLILLASHVAAAIALGVAFWIAMPHLTAFGLVCSAVLFLGLVQFLYGVPWYVRLRRRRRFWAAKGIVFGAIATFILNGIGVAMIVHYANKSV
ncbi:MAG: hypothetical protein WBA76_01945 [Phormidesmis sp.]